MKKKKRMSLRAKTSIVFTGIILLLVFGIAAANQALLGKVYYSGKSRDLTEAYKSVAAVFENDEENLDENLIELEKIYSTKNITVYAYDADGDEIFSSWRSGEQAAREEPFNGKAPEKAPDMKAPEPKAPIERAMPPQEKRGDGAWRAASELKAGEYSIRDITDQRLGSGFMQLSAKLENDCLLMLRTPLSTITDAAKTANTLLLWIGIIAAAVGLLIVMAAVSVVTKPISELTDIAKDMSELHFGRKYKGTHKDEIGELGESINIMSEKLEKAICDLKESNKQLEKDIELKERIDKMRKEFIAGASHELKTPVALILGYAEGLRNNIAATEEDRRFYCDVICDEAARTDSLIKQFLTVAELDEAQEARRENVNLSEVVKTAVKNCSILAKEKGVPISGEIDESIIVCGDEAMLWQAVTNYITNAVHYVDENGVIRVSLHKENDKVRFSVYNSGENIPPEAAERIWESFYKRDKARTRSYGGSGLGLSIVKRSIELHGGVYGFVNHQGGIEFYFEIQA